MLPDIDIRYGGMMETTTVGELDQQLAQCLGDRRASLVRRDRGCARCLRPDRRPALPQAPLGRGAAGGGAAVPKADGAELVPADAGCPRLGRGDRDRARPPGRHRLGPAAVGRYRGAVLAARQPGRGNRRAAGPAAQEQPDRRGHRLLPAAHVHRRPRRPQSSSTRSPRRSSCRWSGRLRAGRVELGQLDQGLFGALAADGRAPYADLATATGWSETTVRRRVDQLRDSGALYFDLELDMPFFGFRSTVWMWLSVPPSQLAAVGTALAKFPEVAYAMADHRARQPRRLRGLPLAGGAVRVPDRQGRRAARRGAGGDRARDPDGQAGFA